MRKELNEMVYKENLLAIEENLIAASVAISKTSLGEIWNNGIALEDFSKIDKELQAFIDHVREVFKLD